MLPRYHCWEQLSQRQGLAAGCPLPLAAGRASPWAALVMPGLGRKKFGGREQGAAPRCPTTAAGPENARNAEESWRGGERPCSLNGETCLIPLKGETHPSLLLKTRLGFPEPALSIQPAGKGSASPTATSLPGRIGDPRCEPLRGKVLGDRLQAAPHLSSGGKPQLRSFFAGRAGQGDCSSEPQRGQLGCCCHPHFTCWLCWRGRGGLSPPTEELVGTREA